MCNNKIVQIYSKPVLYIKYNETNLRLFDKTHLRFVQNFILPIYITHNLIRYK